MRDKEEFNKDSYVIKNGHIDCTKDTYEIFQKTLATQIISLLKMKKYHFGSISVVICYYGGYKIKIIMLVYVQDFLIC